MDSALVSVNGHTEFFKKGISTGLKSGSVAEGRVLTEGTLCEALSVFFEACDFHPVPYENPAH